MKEIAGALWCMLERDLRLALRRKSDALTPLIFFVIVVSLFPLGVGADPRLLRPMAAGVVWVAALLSSMLSLYRLFAADLQDGTLEQLLMNPVPLTVIVFAKIAAHWIVSGLPLALLAPLLGLQFDLPGPALGALTAGLLMGTPVLSLVGAIGAGLTLGLRGGGVLVSLLVLPLNVPILIFGAGAVDGVLAGLGSGPQLLLLAAFLVAGLLLCPWVSAVALRISLE